MTITTLEMLTINKDAGTQMRLDKYGATNTDADAIARYVECIDDLPPVTVMEVEEWNREGSNLLLVDGFHRYAAHLELDRTQIQANVIKGKTFADALTFACKANDGHGLPFTQENKQAMVLHLIEELGTEVYEKRFKLDKKKLMEMAGASATSYKKATQTLKDRLTKERDTLILELNDQGKSQREVADEVECDQKTVSNVLKQVEEKRQGVQIPQEEQTADMGADTLDLSDFSAPETSPNETKTEEDVPFDTDNAVARLENHVKGEALNEAAEKSSPKVEISNFQQWDNLTNQARSVCNMEMGVKREAIEMMNKEQKETLRELMHNLQILLK